MADNIPITDNDMKNKDKDASGIFAEETEGRRYRDTSSISVEEVRERHYITDGMSYRDKFMHFLENHKIISGENSSYTHTAFGPPWGKYNIESNEREEFNKLYSQLVGNYTDLHITEKPNEVGPLLLDIDIKTNKNERIYNSSHILDVINIIMELMTTYFDVNYENLLCFVFEKNKPTIEIKNDVINNKDGFHLIFPNIALNVEMRYLILDELKFESEIVDQLETINDIDDVFDKSVIIKNCWMKYGSRKNNSQLYNLTKIIDSNLEDIYGNSEYKDYSNLDFVKLFDIAKYTEKDLAAVINDDETYKKKIENIRIKYIPQKRDKKRHNRNTNNNISMGKQSDNIKLLPQEERDRIGKVIKLVRILNDRRAINYDEWIMVCWVLHNIHPILYNTWIEFSKRCPDKFDEKKCEAAWNESRDNGLTVASLYWWARQDNPEEYENIINDEIILMIEKSGGYTHYDIAKILQQMYKYTFVCVNIEKNNWYEFKNHRWTDCPSAFSLKKRISEDLYCKYNILIAKYRTKISSVQNEDERIKYEKKCDILQKISHQLKSNPYKNSLIKECCNLFYDENFEQKLDSNCYLIGFNNGIYDLQNELFRPGLPDDYVTLTTKYNYTIYSRNDPVIKSINEYFNTVFVDKSILNYVLTYISSCIDGNIREQKFLFWTGTGSNSKSTTIDLIRYAFGKYYASVPITLLTHKSAGPTQASPELEKLKGVRFAAFQENETDDKLNVSLMKSLTGGDEVSCRALYKNPISFVPQFKPVVACNVLPNITANDNGCWRRVRVVGFESEFVDFPDPNNPLQFPKDKQLSNNIKTWGPAFMYLLLAHWYPKYKKNGIVEPEKVTINTNNYKLSSDCYYEFLSQCTTSDKNNMNISEYLTQFYEEFKIWYKSSYNCSKPPDKKIFINYFQQRGFSIKNNQIYGVSILQNKAAQN